MGRERAPNRNHIPWEERARPARESSVVEGWWEMRLERQVGRRQNAERGLYKSRGPWTNPLSQGNRKTMKGLSKE